MSTKALIDAALKLADVHDETVDGEWEVGAGDTRTAEAEAVRSAARDLQAETAPFEIAPIPDQNYEGRQWGYLIVKDGVPQFECSTGGTGDCWNIDNAPTPMDGKPDMDVVPMHLCDLDETIAALTALRESEAHRLNVERWS